MQTRGSQSLTLGEANFSEKVVLRNDKNNDFSSLRLCGHRRLHVLRSVRARGYAMNQQQRACVSQLEFLKRLQNRRRTR